PYPEIKMKALSRMTPWMPLLMLTGAVSLDAALTAGGSAFTKRFETKLLSEPKPLAEANGTLAYGQKVKVEQVQGPWTRISDGAKTGWVFAGNLSETQPDENKGLAIAGLEASKTTATAAARPLSPAANDYAAKNNLTNARDDHSQPGT